MFKKIVCISNKYSLQMNHNVYYALFIIISTNYKTIRVLSCAKFPPFSDIYIKLCSFMCILIYLYKYINILYIVYCYPTRIINIINIGLYSDRDHTYDSNPIPSLLQNQDHIYVQWPSIDSHFVQSYMYMYVHIYMNACVSV